MDGLTSTPAQRWLARLSFVLAGLAIVTLLVFAGRKSLAMLALGLAAAVVSLASGYFFLSRRGPWRWQSLAVFVVAPITVIIVYASRDLLWIAVLSAALWLRRPGPATGPLTQAPHEPEVATWRRRTSMTGTTRRPGRHPLPPGRRPEPGRPRK